MEDRFREIVVSSIEVNFLPDEIVNVFPDSISRPLKIPMPGRLSSAGSLSTKVTRS